MRRSAQIQGIAIIFLLLLVAGIWYAALREDRKGILSVSFLDVGQGDAVFIEAPSGRQVLIDGGRDSSVLRRLSEVMPWYDRTIDVVVATHPDSDHISGLVDVLSRFSVGTIVHSSVLGDTSVFEALQRRIAEEKDAFVVEAKRGQIVDLGKDAYLEILFPDRSVANVETNTGSIILRAVYGDTAFMLTGDSPSAIERYLVQLDASKLKSNVLKAGHHGSKTSSAPIFLGYVAPEWGVYSRGCDNSYGHPHPDVVGAFNRFEIPTLDTCTEGTITFVSDGTTVSKR